MTRKHKSLEQMTKKELIRLCRRVYKSTSKAGEVDSAFISWLSCHLVGERVPGSEMWPVQDPKTTPVGRYKFHYWKEGQDNPWIPMTSAELSERLTGQTDHYNKVILPAYRALEKAILGKDY